jgi:hypothetical protein
VGDLQKMNEVRLARPAKLIVVALRRNFIGTAYHPGIFGGSVLAELGKQFVQAGVKLALGAVAVKMEG